MRRIEVAPRVDWRETAERLGFRFHTFDGEPYWDESAYYAFSLSQVEDDLESATAELHAMLLDLVAEVVERDSLMDRLGIPAAFRDWVARSWRDASPTLYGRMDLAYDGRERAKLLECNYDTPTALYEAAFFQWVWLEQQVERGVLDRSTDQFNRIQEALVETFAAISPRIDGRLALAALRDAPEDQGTVAYLEDCARQAGLETVRIDVEDIGLSSDGRLTDLDDIPISGLFKLYPLEFMFEDAFGAALPKSGCTLIEPAWKAILSNKGILPLLWQRHPGHPNLLPARFDDGAALAPGWVRKPMLSREGANVEIRDRGGQSFRSDGPYGRVPCVLQAHWPLPVFDGRHAVVGSWIVGDRPAGIGIRDDTSPITRDSSRFVPHVIA